LVGKCLKKNVEKRRWFKNRDNTKNQRRNRRPLRERDVNSPKYKPFKPSFTSCDNLILSSQSINTTVNEYDSTTNVISAMENDENCDESKNFSSQLFIPFKDSEQSQSNQSSSENSTQAISLTLSPSSTSQFFDSNINAVSMGEVEKKETHKQKKKKQTNSTSSPNSILTQSTKSWAQKQEEGFTSWMNFVFESNSTEVFSFDDGEEEEEKGEMLFDDSMSLDMTIMSEIDLAPILPLSSATAVPRTSSAMRDLITTRKRANMRRKGVQLFHSDSFSSLKATLQRDITRGKLSVREDCSLFQDVGLRDEVCDLIMNYSPVWLSLGLEIVCDQELPYKTSLKKFILNVFSLF